MKNLKKFLAFCLILTMVAAVSVTAHASENSDEISKLYLNSDSVALSEMAIVENNSVYIPLRMVFPVMHPLNVEKQLEKEFMNNVSEFPIENTDTLLIGDDLINKNQIKLTFGKSPVYYKDAYYTYTYFEHINPNDPSSAMIPPMVDERNEVLIYLGNFDYITKADGELDYVKVSNNSAISCTYTKTEDGQKESWNPAAYDFTKDIILKPIPITVDGSASIGYRTYISVEDYSFIGAKLISEKDYSVKIYSE